MTTLHTTPFPYQATDVRRIHKEFNGRALLSWSMSLGKTFASLLYIHRHLGGGPTVVICPASLKWNWEREAKTHIGLRAEVLEGTRPQNIGLRRSAEMYIVNYDILGQRQAESSGEGWLSFLKERKPRLVVIDEAHFLSLRAKRTKWAKELCEEVPHVIALSGTPLTNRPSDLWPTLNLLRPDLFPTFWPFARRYCGMRRTPWGFDFRGATHLEELHTTLVRDVMIRRTKEEVFRELPPRIRTVVPLDLSNRREYERAHADFIGWLKEKAPNKARKAMKAELLVKLPYLLRLAAQLKMKAAIQWIDNYLDSDDGKLLVFGIHKRVVRKLHTHYAGISTIVDGSVMGKKRQMAFDKFLTSQNCRMAMCNLQAAGTGWNAKGVNHTAILEFPWAPGTLDQALGRTHGLKRGVEGQPSHYYFLVAKNTAEEKLLEVLRRKQKVLNRVLDGEEGEDFDVLEELARVLLSDSRKATKHNRKEHQRCK